MNILIIDDSEFKIAPVKVILDKHPNINLDVAFARNSGLRKLLDNSYDFLILDMCFPIFEGEFPEDIKEGLSLLDYISRKKINIPTIIYTAEPKNLDMEDIMKKYPNVLGCLDFSYYIGTDLLSYLKLK